MLGLSSQNRICGGAAAIAWSPLESMNLRCAGPSRVRCRVAVRRLIAKPAGGGGLMSRVLGVHELRLIHAGAGRTSLQPAGLCRVPADPRGGGADSKSGKATKPYDG